MRKDRQAGAVSRGTHNLARARLGINKYRRGRYICTCGESFTGVNAYERHRAIARREERELGFGAAGLRDTA